MGFAYFKSITMQDTSKKILIIEDDLDYSRLMQKRISSFLKRFERISLKS